jgi:hypothetical protein
MLLTDRVQVERLRFGGLRSLAAVAGRKPTSFHGADGAEALQRVGQEWRVHSWRRKSARTDQGHEG